MDDKKIAVRESKSPAELIQTAVEGKADLTQLKGLLDYMRKEMK